MPPTEGSLASIDRQIELIDEEIATVEDLLRKGLDRKPRLLALQRARADLDGRAQRGRRQCQWHARADRRDAGGARRPDQRPGARRSRPASPRRARPVNQLRAEVSAARDRLDRTVIRAPVAGEVVDLKLRTLGGVIGPGEPDSRPRAARPARWCIEARVSPKDIDVVHPGLKADVHLTAFHTRHMPRVQGEVIQVSGDRLDRREDG